MAWPMTLKCKQCGDKFLSYPDRKGSDGKYPKYCSRKCYLAAVAAARRRDQSRFDDGLIIKVPAGFFRDHEDRECEPFCEPIKRTSRYVLLRWNDPGLDELLDDAKHYADPDWSMDSCYYGLKRSAVATVKAIEDARKSLAAYRAAATK